MHKLGRVDAFRTRGANDSTIESIDFRRLTLPPANVQSKMAPKSKTEAAQNV
jgi:hypothetical protein